MKTAAVPAQPLAVLDQLVLTDSLTATIPLMNDNQLREAHLKFKELLQAIESEIQNRLELNYDYYQS